MVALNPEFILSLQTVTFTYYHSLHTIHLYGVALRLRRICSRDDWFEKQLNEYYQFFKCRKYKYSVIRKGFDQARNTLRSNALSRKSRANDTRRNLVLIIDYRPNLKGNLRSKKKLSSNERAWKMQNNEPSLTSMRQMVLEIFHFKVRNLSNMDVAIL